MSSGGESSNDSSFAEIINLIDKEGEGANELKAFMKAKAEAPSDERGHAGGDGAVAGWMQRVGQREKQQMQMQSAMAASGRGRYPTRNNVSLNYSKDDSDEEGYAENVLETITG
jgi:phage protein D